MKRIETMRLLYEPKRTLTLLLLVVLFLLISLNLGEAATDCVTPAQPESVNETSPAGYVIDTLNPTYLTTLTVESTYACYFDLVASQLILKQQFDLENFTSCLDGSTIPSASVLNLVTAQVPCVTGGTSTFLIRLVDINEFPPIFVPNAFRLNVSEASPSGSLGDFNMNDGVTSGIVRISRTLDYDKGTRQYIMNISASELPTEAASLPVPLTGYATLTIDVQDFDDLNPYFTQSTYNLNFMENDTSVIGVPLRTTPPILARDGDIGINQTINYAIDWALWSNGKGSLLGNLTFLSINSTTGLITVLTLIDREKLPSSMLLVQVRGYQTDKPDTRVATTLVIVTVGDKNDNAPVMDFPVYNVSIAENSLVGSYVTTVRATDADVGENATVAYFLNDTSGAFQINPITGQLSVSNSALLDRETTPVFVMTVLAQESLTPERFASPPSLLIVNLIDVNDNSPVFSPPNATYSFNVSAVALAGTAVGTVVTTDADAGANGQVRFAIVWASAGATNYFQLDAVTGAVTTLVSLASATTLPASFILQVVAEDQATPVTDRRQSRGIVEIIVTTLLTTSTTLVTTEAPNTTVSTVAATPPPASNNAQLALIVVCVLLFILVLVLVGILLYFWWSARRQHLVQEKLPERDLVRNGDAGASSEMQERETPRAAQNVEQVEVNPNEPPYQPRAMSPTMPRLFRLSGLRVVDLPDMTV